LCEEALGPGRVARAGRRDPDQARLRRARGHRHAAELAARRRGQGRPRRGGGAHRGLRRLAGRAAARRRTPARRGAGAPPAAPPPSWRRDVEGKADLVEEVARIEGFAALPVEPLPDVAPPIGGALTPRQSRIRAARRAMAALGYAETITWSFMRKGWAELFGGGQPELVITNPIASDLDCMRPSILPNLIEAAGRNARRGYPDAALFEIGPIYRGDQPADQATAVAALLSPDARKHWSGPGPEPLFALKADLEALLAETGAPPLQIAQDKASDWWHPGRSARLQLGPKTVIAEIGELHPRILKALDVDGPLYGFEVIVEAIPEPKKKPTKTRPALALSPLMP